MSTIKRLRQSRDPLPLSPDLQEMISCWESIQNELERIAQFEAASLDADAVNQQAITELEERLILQEKALLEAIANYQGNSSNDVIAKLQIWKRIVAPEGSRIEQFTLPDQIALSALRDLESFS